MNRMIFLVTLFTVLGFSVVSGTGVDLASSRTGMGLILLGVGALLWSFEGLLQPFKIGRAWLLCLSFLGGFYFIGRAALGGPVGLALPDVVLVLTFLCIYLVSASSNLSLKRVMVWALAVLCVANIGVAFSQKFGGEAFFVWKEATESSRLVAGLFGHYNPFSGFMNGSIFFFATFTFFGKKIWLRIGSGFLTVAIIAAVVFGGSRGGWVSLAVGLTVWVLMVLAYLKQRKSRVFGVAMISGILFMFIGLAGSTLMIQKIIDQRAEDMLELHGVEGTRSLDDGGRMAFQQQAFEIFKESPLIGMGARSYSYLSLENWDIEKRPLYERPPEFVHNEYLQALSDYGLIGLMVGLLLILVHLISGCYHALTSESTGGDNELPLLQLGAIGGFVAILCQCFFSFLLHVPACMALLALLSGILASQAQSEKVVSTTKGLVERFTGALGIAASVSLIVVGGILTQSYLLSLKANKELAGVSDEESAFRALDTMIDAAHVGRDPNIFEIAGRLSMEYAQNANQSKDGELAKRFSFEAKRAFESGLEYNPNFAAGIAGLPRVEEALGNWKKAEEGHKHAMERLWSREFQLKPHLYAAQSSFSSALRLLYEGNKNDALLELRKAQNRLDERNRILKMPSIVRDDKSFQSELDGWIAFLEAQLLFKEADHVWKNSRPRNSELGYGLMLEAQKRFQASESVVKGKDPYWERLVQQLEFNLQVLEGGRVSPTDLSEKEIAAILGSEAGLDSLPAKR